MRVRQNTPLPPPTAADLESRVAERTRELEEARRALEARSRHSEEVDRLKNAFIANMSHEIRTPLNSVLALTQLLREGVAGPLTVDQRKYLQVIERNGQALLHLINDVLDLSRIEAGHLEMDAQNVDLGAHLEAVTSALAPLAAAKNLDLVVKLPSSLAPARADPDRVRQILTNLVGNAIKFTDDGGQVLVCAEDHPESVAVIVIDTGVGIPEGQQEKIFQEFYQVDSTLARRQGGTGLGLAIARRLARLMGGDITVESVLRRGSRFSLTLPRAAGTAVASRPASEVEPPVPPPAPAAALPATVLVVEDNEDNLFTLRQILARRPLEIMTALSGRQAIERCRQQLPDLIIMDVQMPGMTGLQATGAIRALPGGAEIPIVALTAQAMKGDRERILAAGCDAYLSKPVQPNELVSVVDQLLRRGAADETIAPRAAPPAGPPPDSPKTDGPHGAHTPRR
ncbi:MAG TPA: ATP-binding protein [Polyangia bacterium]|jgi:signal transduction histidine kinase/CheY-like chemotaxis protein